MEDATRAITGVATTVTAKARASASSAFSSSDIVRILRVLGLQGRPQLAARVVDGLLEASLRLPVKDAANGADVRDPVLEVLEARLVRDVEGDVSDSRGRSGALDHHAREIVDPNRRRRADVVDLPDRRIGLDQPDQRRHGVGDVKEAPRLRAVAVDGQVRSTHRLLYESGEDYAIRPPLPRPDNVEQPGYDHLRAQLPHAAQRQRLGV